MAKTHLKCSRGFRRAAYLARFVANIARRHLLDVALRRMALETGHMGIRPIWDRLGNARLGRFMTSRTADAMMTCVRKVSVKALQRRKSLKRSGLSICMTDRTDRARSSG